jgi:hypothetical protein
LSITIAVWIGRPASAIEIHLDGHVGRLRTGANDHVGVAHGVDQKQFGRRRGCGLGVVLRGRDGDLEHTRDEQHAREECGNTAGPLPAR